MLNVDSPDEFRDKLQTSLEQFIAHNEQFNVQGRWTGDDGVTVSVLADFSIEDARQAEAYSMVTVSARFNENLNYSKDELKESQTLMEAENAARGAVRAVFKVGCRDLDAAPEASDIDVATSLAVPYGFVGVKDRVLDMMSEEELQAAEAA